MRILVTGGSGFVGEATLKRLNYTASEEFNYDIMRGYDILDFAQLHQTCKNFQADRVLHLAAIARFADADADPYRAHQINVLGTRNVVEVCEQLHIPLVYASTGSVYMPIKQTPPITEGFKACGNSVYGCTKYLGELYVHRSSVPWIILRYAHLYGAEKRMHGLIGGFLDRIKRGLAPKLYGGQQSNDFTYIDDVAECNVAALKAPWDKWNQAYNVGTGEELTAADAGQLVCDVFGYEGEIEKLEQRTIDPDRFVFDCRKAEIMLGFKARYKFRDGLMIMKKAMEAETVESGLNDQNMAS